MKKTIIAVAAVAAIALAGCSSATESEYTADYTNGVDDYNDTTDYEDDSYELSEEMVDSVFDLAWDEYTYSEQREMCGYYEAAPDYTVETALAAFQREGGDDFLTLTPRDVHRQIQRLCG